MDEFSKKIARALCYIVGSSKNFRSYYNKTLKLLNNPEKGIEVGSNCFGTVYWEINGKDEWPKYLHPIKFESWLFEKSTLCERKEGVIVAFSNLNADFSDRGIFEHAAVYVTESKKTIMVHQEDYKKPYSKDSLEDYLKHNKGLEVEFYRPLYV